jgi:fucokinase
MSNSPEPWHYLILTAANDDQAAAYEAQIRMRRETGQLTQVRDTLVVADPEGSRIGSGGSTLQCLLEVLRRESDSGQDIPDFAAAERVLGGLRILIVHAGGDSRRLPAYSPCGKIFVPLPGETQSALTPTLFDRLVLEFLGLPAGLPGAGQIVVTSGDALIRFDPSEVSSVRAGITALGAWVSPAEAARHGVLCPNSDGSVRLYLQKPDIRRQAEAGAIIADGRSVLDIGVMSLDAGAAVGLLGSFCTAHGDSPDGPAGIAWTPSSWRIILTHGIDLYREICCALGTDATFEEYLRTVRSSGSKLDETVLARLFTELRNIPLHLQVLRQCSFLHFGSTSQLITSGLELVTQDRGAPPPNTILAIGTDTQSDGTIDGLDSWVEGCRLRALLRLQRRNVVVGVDVSEPFELPEGACLDLSPGVDRENRKTWFIRYYGVDDTFKHSVMGGATFCGKPLAAWLRAAGVSDSEVWSSDTPESERTLWNARVFPAEGEHEAYRRWRWMLDIDHATPEQKSGFLAADRYSSAEIAVRVDHDAFHGRRATIRADEIQRSLPRLFDRDSEFSTRDLAFTLKHSDNRTAMVAALLVFAHELATSGRPDVAATGVFPRVVHSLGAALNILSEDGGTPLDRIVPGLAGTLSKATLDWMESAGISLPQGVCAREWALRLQSLAVRA